jgi:acylphosphatase
VTEVLAAKQLRIAGRVQGVGYRANFARQAQRLGLSGWVRNRLDGTVEALVQGKSERVDEIVAWAHRGPSLARVDHVLASDVGVITTEPTAFRVLPTA